MCITIRKQTKHNPKGTCNGRYVYLRDSNIPFLLELNLRETNTKTIIEI